MKSEEDFQSMFAILDRTNKGYLTGDEVQQFYENLFFHNVDSLLANAVLHHVCGSHQCPKKHFQEVLLKLEEWRIIESNCYWDFMAFNVDGSMNISLSSALLLARSVRAEKFSLDVWNQWKSTLNNNQKISWDQFKQYLYFQPGAGKPIRNEAEFEGAVAALSNREAEVAFDEYQFYKGSMESDENYATMLLQEKQQYQEDVEYHSRRLLNRWNAAGVEAVIHDDGTDMEMLDNSRLKDDVTVTELISGIDEKYDILRSKLLWEMVRLQSENDSLRHKVTQADMQGHYSELQSKEKEMRRNGTLEDDASTLYGGNLSFNFNLSVLMGDTADTYQLKWEATEQRYKTYQEEGKSSEEIREIFEKENLRNIKNSATTSGNLLTDLWRRQEQDKQYLSQKLKSAQVNAQSERIALFSALYRQSNRAQEGCNLGVDYLFALPFNPSASGVAVSERKQVFEPTRYSEDSVRQERLAGDRIKIAKQQQKLYEMPQLGERLGQVVQTKDLGLVSSWIEITKLVEVKHELERDMMIFFLHKKVDQHKSFSSLSEEDLNVARGKLNDLYNGWKDNMLSKSLAATEKTSHLQILHDATALVQEFLRKQKVGKRDNEIAATLLAQLQILQDVQYQELVEKMKNQASEDLYRLRKSEYRIVRDLHIDNIAKLLFFIPEEVVPPLIVAAPTPVPEISEEEKLIRDIITTKYDIVRSKLWNEVVTEGKVKFDVDRDSAIQGLLEEEKSVRSKLVDQKAFFDKLQIAYSAHDLFGPLPSAFRSAATLNAESEKTVTIDETQLLDRDELNVISELELRCEDEIRVTSEIVMSSDDPGKQTEQEITRQKWMMSLIDSDVTFTSSAVDLVTLDRCWVGKNFKSKLRQDLKRHIRSTQERFPLENPFNEMSLSQLGAENQQIAPSLRILVDRYPSEWIRFRSLLTDVTAQELREAALSMTSDERVTRLAEINAKRRKIDVRSEDGKEDLLSLLEEASALKHVSRSEILRQLTGDASEKDVGISLLADLQEEQLKDAIKWFDELSQTDGHSLTTGVDDVIRHMDTCENIFAVLCKYEGAADDDHLMQALEDKYDALRDKVLIDALMRQIGEEAWRRMSEKERQARLLKLKLEERRLRREGKLDELAKLLGDAFANDKKLKGLMGLSRDEYERRLKERLEARKRGDAIAEEDEEAGEDLEEDESGINNPLVDLSSRFEEERDALMRLLNGQDDFYMSEKERQRALLRLRQAKLRAIEEERYESAAIVSGLIDREAKNRERLKSDKERQRELARRRLEDMRKKRAGKMFVFSEDDEKIVDVEDRDLMLEAVLKKLHALFNWERSWMSDMLGKISDPFAMKNDVSTTQLRSRLVDVSAKVPRGEVVLQEHYQHLAEAALYRQVGMSIREEELESRDQLDAALLAELQEIQDEQEAKLSIRIPDMSHQDLLEEQKRIVSLYKAGKSRNVPESVLTADFGGNPNSEINDAVQNKFDAIIDSIVAKVLPLKVGEDNWSKMSRDEQKQKLDHLSSSVKELMREGRYEDALALLGDGLSEEDRKALMSLLLGDVNERRRVDLEERTRRRKERMANGMSKVDAFALFDEEGEKFEEVEKKRRKNVLEGLAMDMNAERDALLNALKNAQDKMDADRQRQAYLAKLRLQERQLRRENDLSSIALLVSMSKSHDDALDKEKQRQLVLARERLEAFKRKKAAGLLEEDGDFPVFDLSTDDVTVLADAVLGEMESKHANERVALMQILDSTAPDTEYRKRAEQSNTAERRERVKDLREMRRQWRNEDPQTLVETREEQMDILKEASALQLANISSSRSMSESEMQAYILADLQNVQKKEENMLLDGLLDKSPVVLRKLAEVQRQARVDGWHDNIAGSLLGLEDAHQRKEEEEEVLRALEDKYDALKDKLLAEALMKKLGEKEWKQLSEQERQRRITQIKRQEKKLRRQGKHDDVAKLFRMLDINEKDVARIFGEQKSSQQEDLKKRIAELIEERKRQGLPTGDDDIEKALEEEERLQRKTRKNVLLTLDRNLESEREALLAGLRRQDEAISEERRRQLALAKLRRDRRQMEAEEKYSAVALVFQAAKQDEAAMSASYEDSRKRQRELAQARLSARKNQRKRKEAISSLTDPDKILEKLKKIAEEKTQGPPAEQLISEIGMKHDEERETLMMILLASEDGSYTKDAEKASDEKLNGMVEEFRASRKDWRQERLLRAIKDGTDRPLTDEERKRLSNYVAEQNKQMISTVALLLESKCRSGEAASDVTRESTSVDWLAQLQHTQENEEKFTSDVIGDKSNDYLDILTGNQRRSRREGWNDNIGKVVFDLDLPWQQSQRPASSGSLDSEAQESLEKIEAEMGKVEEDLEKEKEEIERKRALGEDIDADAEISKLQKQFDAKKALLSSDMEKQKAMIREKLRERRQRKDESEFEAHAAAGMVLLADERMKSRDARNKEQASKQKSLMEERLAARREKRRQEQEREEEETGEDTEGPPKGKGSKPSTPLGGARPTLAVPEVDKDEIYNDLIRKSRAIAEKAEQDRLRHLEQVQTRIKKGRARKQNQAVELIHQFESEKTIVDMRESMRISRQKTMLSDRISKLKTERTMTMKEGGKRKANDFNNLVDKNEVEGMDENARMQRIAEKLQKKLEEEKKEESKKEEEERESTSIDLKTALDNMDAAAAEESRPQTSSRRLEKSDKESILKERMQKRKSRRERDATSANPDQEE